MPLILGSIIFTDYTIPETINFGGRQAMTVHKLIGGARVIDAMGPDDEDITWTGRFQGSRASILANQLDVLRASGAEVPLFFAGRFYMVVVAEARLNFQRAYQIPYSVTCTPVSSPNAGGFQQIIQTIDALVSRDMASVANLASQFSAGL
jgi:hypothetical protein